MLWSRISAPRKRRPPPPAADEGRLSRAAINRPRRIKALARRPCCCGHLVRDLSARHVMLAQSIVSRHLGLPVEAGPVDRQRCWVEQLYALNRPALHVVVGDLATLFDTSTQDAS